VTDSEPQKQPAHQRRLKIAALLCGVILVGLVAYSVWEILASQVTDPKLVSGVWANKHGAKITLRDDGSVHVQGIHCQVLHASECTERRDYAGTWRLVDEGVQFNLWQTQGNDNCELTARFQRSPNRWRLVFFTESEDNSE
jgi:hypothetical protein